MSMRTHRVGVISRWLVVAGLAVPAVGRADGAIVTWDGSSDGDGDNTSWHDRLNWDTDTLPGPGDDVVINLAGAIVVHSQGTDSIDTLNCQQSLTVSGGSLEIQSAITKSTAVNLTLSAGTLTVGNGDLNVTTFTMSGGTLDGTGDVMVSALMTWDGGIMSGSGTTFANRTMDLGGITKFLLDPRELQVATTATWTAGDIRVDGLLTIAALGTFDVQTDFDITLQSTPGIIDNQGTFQKSVATGLTTVSVQFDNSNTVDVQTGTVSLNGGGTHTGDFMGLATLRFGGGNHTLETTSDVTASNVTLSAATTEMHGTYDVLDQTTVSAGTHTFHLDATVLSVGDTLEVSGGVVDFSSGETIAVMFYDHLGGELTGSDTVTVSDVLTWDGGVMSGSGTIFADGTTNLGGITKFLVETRELEVAGSATWTAGNIRVDGLVTIPTLATFDVQTDADITFQFTPGIIDNQGTFQKSVATGLTTVGVQFDNSNTVDVQTGTVSLNGGGTHTGDFMGPGTLGFGGGTHTLQTTSDVTRSNVTLTGGTTDVHGTYDVSDETTVIGGTHTFHRDATVVSVGDTLTVANGTVDFSSGGTIAVTTYTHSNGTLTGSDTVTVSDALTWNGGTMRGSGMTSANGTLDMGGALKLLLDTRELVAAPTTTWTAGQIRVDGLLTIPVLATFDVQTDFDITFSFTPGTVDNQGTFQKSVATGLTTVGVQLDNSNTVDVQTGTVSLNRGGTHTGDFMGMGTLGFGGGDHILQTTSDVTASNVIFSFGTTDIHGTYMLMGSSTTVSAGSHTFHPDATVVNVGDTLTITFGTVDFSSGETIAVTTYTHSNGTLTGSDTVTVSDVLTWNGGTMSGSGATVANGTLNLGVSVKFLLDTRELQAAPTTTWTAGQIRVDGLLTIPVLATFDVQTDADITFTSTPGTVDNQGTFQKSEGTSATSVNVEFDNSNTVDVQTGTVSLNRGGTHTGDFMGLGTLGFGGGDHTVQTTSDVTASNVIFSAGTTDIHGTYMLLGSSTTVSGGGPHTFHPDANVLDAGDTLTVTNGTVDFSSGETIAVTTYTHSTNGTLTGSDTVTVSDVLTWNGGTMSGSGATVANGTLNLGVSVKSLLDTRELVAAPTTIWTAGNINLDGLLTIPAPATFDVQTDADITFTFAPGSVDNQGTFRKSVTAGTTSVQPAFTNNGGTVEVLTGILGKTGGDYVQTDGTTTVESELEVSGAGVVDLQGGVLNGNGLVNADVNNAAAVSPSTSPGELTVEGTYTQFGLQTGKGTLLIELGGLLPIVEHDVLTILGDAQLAGALNITTINGFMPMTGDQFTILTTTGSVNEQFELVDCTMWQVNYNPNDVTITAIRAATPGDVNCDGTVDVADLLIVLGGWGDCPDPPNLCPADIDDDGMVSVTDLLIVLGNWTT